MMGRRLGLHGRASNASQPQDLCQAVSPGPELGTRQQENVSVSMPTTFLRSPSWQRLRLCLARKAAPVGPALPRCLGSPPRSLHPRNTPASRWFGSPAGPGQAKAFKCVPRGPEAAAASSRLGILGDVPRMKTGQECWRLSMVSPRAGCGTGSRAEKRRKEAREDWRAGPGRSPGITVMAVRDSGHGDLKLLRSTRHPPLGDLAHPAPTSSSHLWNGTPPGAGPGGGLMGC